MGNKLHLKVIRPGLFSSVQDYGRPGYQEFGVPQSGVMSKRAADRANWLVGNAPGTPVVEITLFGPTIKLQGQGHIAFSGGEVNAKLDDAALPFLSTIRIDGIHTLTFGPVRQGCRSYLAIAGDWKVSPWLNSYSASSVQPTVLTPQSILKVGMEWVVEHSSNIEPRQLEALPVDGSPIRVLSGPEYNQFGIESIQDFLTRSFEISPQSNRMGFRLSKGLKDYQSTNEVISSGIIPGTIQVTNSGELIVLMADAQTSGGYPRIANVISEDINRVAQLKPGDYLRFSLVSLAEASKIQSQNAP